MQESLNNQNTQAIQLTADEIRDICRQAGADDAGFVEIERQALAPEKVDILKIYPKTRSLIAIAKLINQEAVQSPATNIVDEEFHRSYDDLPVIARRILRRLNERGVRGVVTPYAFPMDMNRAPGKVWDISHKLVAREAGLGEFGLNRLVLHPKFGNFIGLLSILIDSELDRYDHPVKDNPCIDCKLCVSACPVGAIHHNGQFDFMACFTHTYRELMAGFQDWIEAIVSAKNVAEYRSIVRDSETSFWWQSLTFGHGYKCVNCMAVCPAGEVPIENYSPDKKAYVKQIVKPLKEKSEPIYVLAGTRAEKTVRNNPNKEARIVHSPLRPTSIKDFLDGVTLLFNPEKAENITLTLHFVFTGEVERLATIKIENKKMLVLDDHVDKPNLIVTSDAGTWVKLVNEEISTFKAIITGKLKVKGNPLLMNKFKSCLMK
ncbi:MAG: SCP2 sterol-binding domain-containing protein [Deltaproteobacteria bacterium]|nr:MAG: SCP2 sterol-binding domain-containing protein [Deltaproteobacteria bacterium]